MWKGKSVYRYIRSVTTRSAARLGIKQGAILGISLILFVACGNFKETSPKIVTQVVMQNDQEIVVTREVRQTTQIDVTPILETPDFPVVLDISHNGGFESLDPQTAVEDNAIDIMENVFAGLTNYNLATNTLEPELALSWNTSNDGLTWTFILRDDIFWLKPFDEASNIVGDDGGVKPIRPVMAEDIVYAIQRACDPRIPTPDVFILFIIEGCEEVHTLTGVTDQDFPKIGVRAINEKTLEITLKQPASHFLTVTSMWLLRPVPPELIAEMGDEWHLPENIWLSGPFIFGSGTSPDTRTVLFRNPYWPIPFSGNVERVNILHLLPTDAYLLWEDRNLDISPVPIDQQTEILSRHELKADLISNQEVFYLAYNFESPVFRYPEIRRAFGWAIDRERLIREVYGGRAFPMRHIGPPGVIGAPPIDEVGTGYSPDRARQEMDNSIFGDCRLMPPIKYMVSSSDLALQQAELLREMWMEELNCTEEQIIIEQVQFGNLLASTRPDAGQARPDMWDLGWASYYPDENNWLGDVLHCLDSENRQKRPCASVDDDIRRANEAIPIEQRWELYRQAERSFFGENAIEPISPLFVRGDYQVHHGWVSYVPAHFGGEQYDTYIVDAEVKDLERSR